MMIRLGTPNLCVISSINWATLVADVAVTVHLVIVDGNEYVGEAALCCFEQSNRVKSPTRERPGWRNRPQGLGQDMFLLGEELAPRTSPYNVPGISQGCWPVEARPEGFANQG